MATSGVTDAELAAVRVAFWRYERALMSDDVAELDRCFLPGPATLRADAAAVLVGSDAIAAFRAGRGGAPARIVDGCTSRGWRPASLWPWPRPAAGTAPGGCRARRG